MRLGFLFKSAKKGVKKFVSEKVKKVKNTATSAEGRVALGIIMAWAGMGLVMSGFIRVPS